MPGTTSSIHPALADLLARVHGFLDEAEAALAAAEPERIAQSGVRWAPLARELKKIPDAQWHDPTVKAALLGTLASRVAALQQALGRAQVRTNRELALLMGVESQDQTRAGPAGDHPLNSLRPVYDAGGARAGTVRAAGTYA